MSRRIFIIYPGHGTATIDVARGLHHGFQALGCTVEHYPLEGRAEWFAGLLEAEQRVADEARSEAALGMCGEEIPGRILRFEPDAVIVVHGQLLSLRCWQALEQLRALCAVHLVLTECPYEDAQLQHLLPQASVVWANDRTSAERWGCRYLPAGYDPAVHHPPAEPIRGAPDVLFVGTGWGERCRFFSAVDWSGLWFRIVGPLESWPEAHGRPLERHIEDAGIPGSALWPYYAGAGAVVNLHRRSVGLRSGGEVGDGYSLNPRAYQVPACGGLLLSDWRPEFDEIFRGVLPTFETPAELGDLVRYFHANPGARQDAILASLEAVQPHSYTARAAAILEEV